jgi:uncharacterized damage-inducible protein DinB
MNADPRFPVGPFVRPQTFDEGDRAAWIEQIAATPAALRAAVHGLDDVQLATPYREGGWTVRQLVHHVPDSHMNAYVRFRLALTEDEPIIKPYEEQLWAELPDGKSAPIAVSLDLLDRLHERWLLLLRALGAADFARTLIHPVNGAMSLHVVLALYAWHGRHHVAHVTALREREGWG